MNKYILLLLALCLGSVSSEANEEPQKVCNVSEKELRNFIKIEESKALQLCKLGDILIFSTKGGRLYEVSNAMSRVCKMDSSFKLGNKNGICIFTGEVLKIANE